MTGAVIELRDQWPGIARCLTTAKEQIWEEAMSPIADCISVVGTSDAADRRRRIVAIVGASSGNLVEWYDFYAYAFTSIYFAAAFFPSGDATSQWNLLPICSPPLMQSIEPQLID